MEGGWGGHSVTSAQCENNEGISMSSRGCVLSYKSQRVLEITRMVSWIWELLESRLESQWHLGCKGA